MQRDSQAGVVSSLSQADRSAPTQAPTRCAETFGKLVEVVDDVEAENKALESLRNAGPPDSARASESIGDPSGDVSLGSDVVLNIYITLHYFTMMMMLLQLAAAAW